MNTSAKLIISIFIFGLFTRPVLATRVDIAEASAHTNIAVKIEDSRVKKLKSYLKTHDSPLVDEADHFVTEADRLGLDWKLVAAISGVESTFGKRIPRNSYNGWGWAIYTGQSDGKHFVDWKDGITQVSEGLRYKYIDRGAVSIEQIGRIYAASPTWSQKVHFFLNKIENFSPIGVDHLAVTI